MLFRRFILTFTFKYSKYEYSNFETFKEFYSKLHCKFSIICFSETLVDDISISKNSKFQLSNYSVIYQVRENGQRGLVCIFVNESMSYKIREDLSINCDSIKSRPIEIINKRKNIIFSVVYRLLNGNMKTCEDIFKSIFLKNDENLSSDFNLTVLYYETNKKVQKFLIFFFAII